MVVAPREYAAVGNRLASPPRKLFLGWGARDEGTPEPMYRAFCDAVRRRDLSALTVHEEPDRGHEITASMLDAGLSFLAVNLPSDNHPKGDHP